MPIATPGGRYLGRKPDKPDPRDHRYGAVHGLEPSLPPRVDLRPQLPPCFDQGALGSCGPNSGDGLMCFLYPELAHTGFSRLHIYYNVRLKEGTVDQDSGVETRDVLAVLMLSGAAPESDWPYDVARFKEVPPEAVNTAAEQYTLASFSRLVAEQEMLSCLAAGFPFLLGFECFASIDSEDLARTGVMPFPNASEALVGGHDVLCVGYDLNFKSSDEFKRSGLDPSRVADQALLIRNSWGTSWGDAGHFWMPLPYASNPSTGGDAWTGRIANPKPPQKETIARTLTDKPQGQAIDPGELEVAQLAVRQAASKLSYMGISVGGYITDDECRDVASAVVAAVEAYRNGKSI